jgi:hypothetical protein
MSLCKIYLALAADGERITSKQEVMIMRRVGLSEAGSLNVWFTSKHEKCLLAGNIFSSPIVL